MNLLKEKKNRNQENQIMKKALLQNMHHLLRLPLKVQLQNQYGKHQNFLVILQEYGIDRKVAGSHQFFLQ